MRIVLLAAALLAVAPAALAQQAPVPTPAPAPVPSSPATAIYSTEKNTLGELMDYPATRAVLEKHISEMINNPQISMARGLTLRALHQYAPDAVSLELLEKIDADLAEVPAKP